MNIKIGQPCAFSEQGRKDQQEDRIFPTIEQLSTVDYCFVLCDGMGGHEKGEVAAGIVSETLQKSLVDNPPADNIASKAWFEQSLNAAYNALDKMDSHSDRRPGTTMTCVYLAANGALCAHIGDSRIYLVRPGEGIMYRSEDHSLVNQLVRMGEITEEQAAHHPKRNIITRAMQPQLDRRFAADVKIIDDIRKGDYLFLCCDGILEQLSDQQLVEIISAESDVNQKLTDIYDVCFGKTNDNFTCILVPIEDVEGVPAQPTIAANQDEQVTSPDESYDPSTATMVKPESPVFPGAERSIDPNTARKIATSKSTTSNTGYISHTNDFDAYRRSQHRSKLLIYCLCALLAIGVGIGAYFLLSGDDKKQVETSTSSVKKANKQADKKTNNNTNENNIDNSFSKDVVEGIIAKYNELSPDEQANILSFFAGKKMFDELSNENRELIDSWRKSISDIAKEQNSNIDDKDIDKHIHRILSNHSDPKELINSLIESFRKIGKNTSDKNS